MQLVVYCSRGSFCIPITSRVQHINLVDTPLPVVSVGVSLHGVLPLPVLFSWGKSARCIASSRAY